MTGIEAVRVDLGARGYDVQVGLGALAEAGRYLAPVLAQRRVVTEIDGDLERDRLQENVDVEGELEVGLVGEGVDG